MVRQAEEVHQGGRKGRKPEFDFGREEEKALERDRAMAEEVFSSIERVVMDTPDLPLHPQQDKGASKSNLSLRMNLGCRKTILKKEEDT